MIAAEQRAELKNATLKIYEADLNHSLDRLLALDPIHAPGLKLKRMIRKERPNLFVFVRNRELEPTSNGSDRALRALRDLTQDHQRLPPEVRLLVFT